MGGAAASLLLFQSEFQFFSLAFVPLPYFLRLPLLTLQAVPSVSSHTHIHAKGEMLGFPVQYYSWTSTTVSKMQTVSIFL